ncbi:MAG: glycoside hydrolase family 66 protein, partial [Limisphaerales bacterium]
HLDPFRTSHGVVVSTTDDKNWIGDMQKALKNPPTFKVPPSVRVVVRDQPERTIVHLLNLNVQRISSFEDKVTPVANISLKLHVPLKQVRSVEALTADESATQGTVEFTAAQVEDGSDISFQVPSLDISTIIVIQ